MSRLAHDAGDSAIDEHPPRVGRYELGRAIAAGGLATVFHARDPLAEADVAVKRATPRPDRATRARDRLRHEGRMLRRFGSPSILSLLDEGEDGLPYLVLELAVGSLSHRLEAGVPRDPWTVARIVDQVTDAVTVVHAHGIAHCDVHPGNLMIVRGARTPDHGQPAALLEPDERLVLGDFDIAVDIAEAQRPARHPFGTPRFRAPEQIAADGSISVATDTYALGALTWALVAGTSPPLPDEIHDATAAVPPWWATVLRIAMATDPEQRFPSAAAWREAVREALDTDFDQAGHDPLP